MAPSGGLECKQPETATTAGRFASASEERKNDLQTKPNKCVGLGQSAGPAVGLAAVGLAAVGPGASGKRLTGRSRPPPFNNSVAGGTPPPDWPNKGSRSGGGGVSYCSPITSDRTSCVPYCKTRWNAHIKIRSPASVLPPPVGMATINRQPLFSINHSDTPAP